MIERVEDFKTGFSLGFRYGPCFTVIDHFGSICDGIMYSDGAYFDATVFPLTQALGETRKLHNKETGDYLELSPTDCILEVNFKDKLTRENQEETIKKFYRQVILAQLADLRIDRVQRIGIVNRYIIKKKEYAEKFLKSTLKGKFNDINNISLEFSKKYSTDDSLTNKGINNYKNVIIQVVKKPDLDEIFFSLDYQLFFTPELESLKKIDYTQFLHDFNRFNTINFLEWLNESVG
jgi:hypothetical protein